MEAHPDFEDLATGPLVNAIAGLKKDLMKHNHEARWRDPVDFMQELFVGLKEGHWVGRMHYERLGSMGFKVFVDHCEAAQVIHARKIIGPVCPKILMVALMLKGEFPKLKLKVDYSAYTKEGAASEVLFK